MPNMVVRLSRTKIVQGVDKKTNWPVGFLHSFPARTYISLQCEYYKWSKVYVPSQDCNIHNELNNNSTFEILTGCLLRRKQTRNIILYQVSRTIFSWHKSFVGMSTIQLYTMHLTLYKLTMVPSFVIEGCGQ